MDITIALKERFCKDLQLPIKIFTEPYFTERLELYDRHFNCLEKYQNFVEMLQKYSNEQEYFEEYNSLKEKVIQHISNNPFFHYFSTEENMDRFTVKNKNFPHNSIYRSDYIGKHFISFDMCKGNFTALRHYSPNIVDHKDTYEEFIMQFTDNKHLINSKYIRQVIFGTLNPKRQVKYEEYLMNFVLEDILTFFSKDAIVYYSTDEIVVAVDGKIEQDSDIYNFVASTVNKFIDIGITIRGEIFSLDCLTEYDVYIKNVYIKVFQSIGKPIQNSELKVIKNANHLNMPFILRKIYNLKPSENDNVFLYEGRLAKFID